MAIVLKYVIPVLSLAVLVLCLVAAFFDRVGDEAVFNWHAFQGGIPTYFIAKGIFCSVALFLLGKLTEAVMQIRRS